MRQSTITALFLFSFLSLFSQNNLEDYVKEGIEHHDNGDYDNAIASYSKALDVDPKSTLAHYEMSLSYFSKGNYEEAVKYSDFVLKQNEDYLLEATLTKGSSLDMLGKTKESIKLFEKAIKQKRIHYLLHFNLGINYYKLNDLDKAEEQLLKAIELNPNHSSSHLILSYIHNQKGNTVQTLLASHYFLFLEPDSERSKIAYQNLQNNFGGNVTKDPEKPNNINILLSINNDKQFGAAELMISMLEASKSLEENKDKTKDEMFIKNTESFFKILGELKEDNNKKVWWKFYIPFFYDLAKSDHLETYCNYISQIENEEALKWLAVNNDKLVAFDQWLRREQ
ncbi:tetratricopeptide repeat protein [Maribacter sp. SA7]|uniref:tetratricopeptide repeat protein n=1 Tax=Maribacter zhoushanensis TaxID=3030012 RepID=UPI0023EA81F7|nr:tetratricopeptide repeat protein [Maribacter zhoushanensis]MDF4203800.1 tetratricopeptide repeat protein [Maribacter zhoushanensis]